MHWLVNKWIKLQLADCCIAFCMCILQNMSSIMTVLCSCLEAAPPTNKIGHSMPSLGQRSLSSNEPPTKKIHFLLWNYNNYHILWKYIQKYILILCKTIVHQYWYSSKIPFVSENPWTTIQFVVTLSLYILEILEDFPYEFPKSNHLVVLLVTK